MGRILCWGNGLFVFTFKHIPLADLTADLVFPLFMDIRMKARRGWFIACFFPGSPLLQGRGEPGFDGDNFPLSGSFGMDADSWG